MPKGQADVHISCECGSAIRLYTTNTQEKLDTLAWWDALHHGAGHQECTADEATQVRVATRWDAANRRRSRAQVCTVCNEPCKANGRHLRKAPDRHRAVLA